jgi:peptidyl-dipeptidase Dcp
MRRYSATFLTLPVALLLAACGERTSDYAMTDLNDNVLLAEWTGPYGGVPAFDEMHLAALKPALEKGMELELAEIDAIANNPEPATFENTIEALEGVGDDLSRVSTYRGIWSSNMSSPEFREIQMEMAPRMAEHRTKITQNQALFERIRAVYESDEAEGLRPDQQRLLWLVYDGFARNGATLEGEAKERYAEINQRLAELHTEYGNNVLADEEGYVTYLSEDQLSGLPEAFVAAAAAAAADRGHEGEYAVTNTRSSMDPLRRSGGRTTAAVTTATNTTTTLSSRRSSSSGTSASSSSDTRTTRRGGWRTGWRRSRTGSSSSWRPCGPRPRPGSRKKWPICRR